MDFAARWLQSEGKGYYTIGSAGHESNAALGLVTRRRRSRAPALPLGRLLRGPGDARGADNPVRDLLLSLTSSRRDPISGGRHKVFGHPDLHIVPQTSTIGSHLPRAVGLAYSLGLARALGRATPWPADAIVVCSFGDASANHSTVTGALNAASYLAHRERAVPRPVRLRGQPDRDQHAVAARVARRRCSRASRAFPTCASTAPTRRACSSGLPGWSTWCGTRAGRRCWTSRPCG